ncbi:MAG: L-rhamnose mutarotase [Bacteroidia bacterium]|nr:L-rhamnose mutarotase [Bacteroidia bacterium]NNF30668.1 hypothetical protein [Flavobacteriaceae bacterium]MBT8277287.1 L-rhamnose mutarotase [Bacteroidia bacterium]NNJ81856.1 hypothetical protein [Flavobacteriaceae bacterium]NNK54887.1 hypothetical protein [Flavobacteriaceae bacterium]
MKTIKTIKFLGLIVSLLLFFSPGSIVSQDAPEKMYVEIGCLKSKSDNLEAFIKDKGMAFNREAQAKGMLLDFIVLKVIYPNGEDCKCDYRMVSVYNDMKQLDMFMKPNIGYEIATKAFGGQEQAQAAWEEWQGVGVDKGSELFELEMSAMPGPSGSDMSIANFVNVKPGMEMEYEKMEREVWMPVVKEAIKAGMLNDMTIWSRVMPAGEHLDGDYIQVIDINNFAQMGSWEWEEFGKIFQKVHPGVDMMEMVKKSNALSTLGHNETVQVVARLSDPN